MHPLVRTASVVVVSLALLVGGAASATAAPELAAPTAKQQVFWKWSDGSQKTSRVFREARYNRAGRLPKIIVTAVPAKPRRVVILQFKQKGKWLVERRTSTSTKGVATLTLDPYCTNKTWCDGTWNYRIKVGTLYQVLKVTYVGQ
jgi:hypothetical protein